MARAKGRRTSTLVLAGWALLMLALGLGAGLLLGQQGCNRREAPAKKEAPRPESKKPEKKLAEPKTKPSSEAAKPLSPEPAQPLPRLALVIDDLGYIQPELVTRLCSQPVPFSVAVLPYQEHTRESADIAHRLGKEVMLHLPMEPIGYPGPGRDPGPNAILYNLPEAEVRRRVRMALDDIPHRTGVNNHMGSRITPDRTRMGWVLQEVKARKYFFVDSRTEKDSVAFDLAEELGIPAVQRRVFLDDDKTFPEMEKQWERALKLAEKEGAALIIGHIYPETVEALEKLVPRSKGRVRFVRAGELVK
ncbi:MAG: divergent polysaccharide deacetylase family protein [Geothrix sp.]|uniref:Divergent polysaccharide deacetylase family protein n=1 Tax=Candidatus Geothrix odensensis TaxID=2954440 RepID=A0A936K6D2_9BACT|nr:divergent polysaccharide deacetylase family protein [Candidatus Geothrix odensensis]MBP7618633.1 divergent polysaccharide deacetylase family protein [Geothrix sp.]